MDPLQIVFQFLKEEGYDEAFEALRKESGKDYIEGLFREHLLRQTFGEIQKTGEAVALRSLLEGPKLSVKEDSQKKITIDASPIALISLDKATKVDGVDSESLFVASFNDKSVRLFNDKLEELKSNKLSLPTILCFQQRENKLYFSTMGGEIGVFDLATFDVEKTIQICRKHIPNIRTSGDYLVVGAHSGELVYIKLPDFTIDVTYNHPNTIVSMCCVNDGVIYALQNDNIFHFRSTGNHSQIKYLLMNPLEFAVQGFGVRDMRESPTDPSVFIVLTDQNRAVIYKYTVGSPELGVLTNITHITSDGLTQQQLIWPTGPVAISTTDDLKVVAIDLSLNKVVFELSEWRKTARCLTVNGDKLIIGAFDKTLTSYHLDLITE
jgi:hypothetical protein